MNDNLSKCPTCNKNQDQCDCINSQDYPLEKNALYQLCKKIVSGQVPYENSKVEEVDDESIDYIYEKRPIAYVNNYSYALDGILAHNKHVLALIVDVEELDSRLLDESNVDILFIGPSVKRFRNDLFYAKRPLSYIEVDSANQYFKVVNNNLYSHDLTMLYSLGNNILSFIAPNNLLKIKRGASYITNLQNVFVSEKTVVEEGAFLPCTNIVVSKSKTWLDILEPETKKVYFKELLDFLKTEYANYTIYPKQNEIFKALELTPFDDCLVCILGQDPYFNENQAHGLAFSVTSTTLPPTLKNIYKELNTELQLPIAKHGNLEKWAHQGVLLLNTVLTVRAGKANSHQGKGWEKFTNKIIEELNSREKPVIFILWGNNAIKKEAIITNPQHYVLKSAHPSPLSAYNGFFNSNVFININQILKEYGLAIDWDLTKEN